MDNGHRYDSRLLGMEMEQYSPCLCHGIYHRGMEVSSGSTIDVAGLQRIADYSNYLSQKIGVKALFTKVENGELVTYRTRVARAKDGTETTVVDVV
jgi:hypothetical protein